MTDQDRKATYNRDGFLVVRQLMKPAAFTELTTNLDRYIRDIVPGLPDSDAFYHVNRSVPQSLKQMQHMEQDAYFAEYRTNPVWKALAESILGEEAKAHGVEWFNKPPATDHVTPPHQDNYYFCLRPPQVLTIWMALDRVDEANGCLRYVKGSHLRGVRPHGRTQTLGFSQGITDYGTAEDRADEVPVCLEPGDVTIHHGNTIHRADANITPDRHRRSFAMVFQGVSAQRDEVAFARYLEASKAQQKQLVKS